MIWLVEDECRAILIHRMRKGALFKCGAVKQLVEVGQRKYLYDRVSVVVFVGMRVMSGVPACSGDGRRRNE